MKIALFATCIVDAMYPSTARATVSILERLGHDVVFPAGQACCGQMHLNSGYFPEAVPVVRNHVEAFEAEDYDVAVAPSGSCVASVKHQHAMLARSVGDPDLESRATAVGARTYELSALLTDVLGVTDAAAQLGSWYPHRITYHPSCHGMRLLRLGDRQANLLRTVEGLELEPLPEADQCCGFGGTFSLKNADVSSAMLADKNANIAATGAQLCSGGDASCLMHLGGGLSREGSSITTLHFAEILASTHDHPAPPPGAGRDGARSTARLTGKAGQ
ncbi:(Fe-S)-binding protein [Arthrobacter sp. zg-Y1110]|uniref:(Fe-S)-binding protein n=1 Tax=Arthrobacter sp. zg-Y1110 TaxID=2886932 RepID=UPI001D1555DB|nr:(Fe-S)-binding protein [Arthrobacter sp. zg-Y1110]MCC3291863.1 (Fe-S)-binding protein [Arthrobacter sp. zg-Y1110]UWX85691.1 (Fe-S)-binding protein [Arthrobacter sp. zg-Y1110]